MVIDENKIILDTYNELKCKFGSRLDSLKVVNNVINYRNFWKPDKIKTLLLGESHVFTTDSEAGVKISYPMDHTFDGLPDNFVKLVYCLGYGEKALVPEIEKNDDTWQFWKIFAACASDIVSPDYAKILKYGAGNFQQRLRNKINLLNLLKQKGIWLVDCSIIGLYNPGKKKDIEAMKIIIPFCWDNYISEIIIRENPGYIIVIGQMLEKYLDKRVRLIGVQNTTVPQPQKRYYDNNEALQIFQNVCSR